MPCSKTDYRPGDQRILLELAGQYARHLNELAIPHELATELLVERRLEDCRRRGLSTASTGQLVGRTGRRVNQWLAEISPTRVLGQVRRLLERDNSDGLDIEVLRACKLESLTIGDIAHRLSRSEARLLSVVNRLVKRGALAVERGVQPPRHRSTGKGLVHPEPTTHARREQRAGRALTIIVQAGARGSALKLAAELTAEGIDAMRHYLRSENEEMPTLKAVQARDAEAAARTSHPLKGTFGVAIAFDPAADPEAPAAEAACLAAIRCHERNVCLLPTRGGLDAKAIDDFEGDDVSRILFSLKQTLQQAEELGSGPRTRCTLVLAWAPLSEAQEPAPRPRSSGLVGLALLIALTFGAAAALPVTSPAGQPPHATGVVMDSEVEHGRSAQFAMDTEPEHGLQAGGA